MFVDASAIVAIITREAEADVLADRLEAARAPVTSPIAIFEAALGIRRLRRSTVAEAYADVIEFLAMALVQVVPVSPGDADAALLAFDRYGKGQGHPARLNLGDCFAYAIARNNDLAILYKGDDFSQTDLAAIG
jgi:ribonuclease VapC